MKSLSSQHFKILTQVQLSLSIIVGTTIKGIFNNCFLLSSVIFAASASSAYGIQLNFGNAIGELTNSNPNNIGATMTFNKVANDSGTNLNLVIEVVDSYSPNNSANNDTFKNNQNIGRINVGANTATRFKFSFVETDTGNSYTISNLDFSMLDLDGNDNTARERVILYSNADYTLVQDTEFLNDVNFGDRVEITSTVDSVVNPSDTANPNTSEGLTLDQEKHSILFSFDTVSEFELGYEAIGGNSGRNFLFAGEMVFDSTTETKDFTAVPFEFSPAFGLLLCGGSLLGIKHLKQKKLIK